MGGGGSAAEPLCTQSCPMSVVVVWSLSPSGPSMSSRFESRGILHTVLCKRSQFANQIQPVSINRFGWCLISALLLWECLLAQQKERRANLFAQIE